MDWRRFFGALGTFVLVFGFAGGVTAAILLYGPWVYVALLVMSVLVASAAIGLDL